MRLGVLGPANGDLVTLAKAAQLLLDKAGVERVLYLGADDALDRVVAAWAAELVGGNPRSDLVFDRAAKACAVASPEAIEAFVAGEHARQRLSVLTSVPPPPGRTIELFDGRITMLVFDKATLDEDDIAGATLLVFGKSDGPVIHPIGSRLFFSPGALRADATDTPQGSAVIDDQAGGIRIEIIDAAGDVASTERVDARLRGAKMRVQGPAPVAAEASVDPGAASGRAPGGTEGGG